MLASMMETAVNERPSIGTHIIPRPGDVGNSAGAPWPARQVSTADFGRVRSPGVADGAVSQEAPEMVGTVSRQRSRIAYREQIISGLAQRVIEIGEQFIAELRAVHERMKAGELRPSSLPPRS
jgi:hypothetical protein